MKTQTIEWAPFTVRAGVSEAELLQASEDLQVEFLSRQRGFIRRELLHGEGRQWCDLVYWESADDARRAVQEAADSPVCFRYFQLMEAADHADPGAGVQHFAMRTSYQASSAAAA